VAGIIVLLWTGAVVRDRSSSEDTPMQVGVDSLAAAFDENSRAVNPAERLRQLVQRIEHADEVGVDAFGVGEHHRREFLDSAPAVILGAAAARTQHIRLTSAVTVLSAEDPVRAFQNFATLDLLSRGRAEMIVGRGSCIEAFRLFGLRLEDYDALFAEKLDLLLNIREHEHVQWSGTFRPALTGQGVYPRPVQNPLPIWLGVGGTPASFVRAGELGLPLMVAIIGGEPRRFRPLIDFYRQVAFDVEPISFRHATPTVFYLPTDETRERTSSDLRTPPCTPPLRFPWKNQTDTRGPVRAGFG
jgi:alkanesulfonate monooxygenase SsuD/methylene tetrahydromethanopterin reductase-like flavin-dependent oxidoreductase (luciferase family)